MVSQRLGSAVERLARDMPRNPSVIELVEALKAERVASTAVETTPQPIAVVSTGCSKCQKRREKKRETMRAYRAKK